LSFSKIKNCTAKLHQKEKFLFQNYLICKNENKKVHYSKDPPFQTKGKKENEILTFNIRKLMQ
jgi:hypothetical protein